jgi:hypothetical protein
MANMPILGGFSSKAAAAYLLPPVKPRKRKKSNPAAPFENLGKEASEFAVIEQNLILQRQIAAGAFSGGWNLALIQQTK